MLTFSKILRHSAFSWSRLRYFSTTPIHHVISNVAVNSNRETIEVRFQHLPNYLEYPWIFLQDNCLCDECFHVSSKSRKKLMRNLDLEKTIVDATILGDRGCVTVQWSDGHRSTFGEEWLIKRRFTQENLVQRCTTLRDFPRLFGSGYKITHANFQEVLSSPVKLCALLKTLCQNGVFLLTGALKQTGELRKFVEKFGFLRTTHYGNEFTVKSEPNASNIAYTSTSLGVHTDLPYTTYPPSVQLLHCIKQYDGDARGGSSHLVDGFQVAAQLRQDNPEAYHLLSTVLLEFEDIGQDFTKFHKIHHSPTFVHSPIGNLIRIVYSNQQLSSCMPVPLDQVKGVYEALKIFTDACYGPKNLMEFKLNEGDVLIFDNWRVLHGREAFDASKGSRMIEGCYVDWDEIYSSIRVLDDEISNAHKNPYVSNISRV